MSNEEEKQSLLGSGGVRSGASTRYTESSLYTNDAALDGGPDMNGHTTDTVVTVPCHDDDQNGSTIHYTYSGNKMHSPQHDDAIRTSPNKTSPSRTSRSLSLELSISGPVEPVTLSWDKINVFVQPSSGGCCRKSTASTMPKHILKDVSGIVKPGQLLAIIGASGAGKTTLLNVITHRLRGPFLIEGSVRTNGQSLGRAITGLSAYVQQDDLFIGIFTVREHLRFRANLGMPRYITKNQRLQRVEEVIKEMGLTKCADTLIGTPGRIKGISGGEMKRLSFASETLSNPALMFCDEPTSGLDSFMAQNIVQTLQIMAAKGRTVVCTIHQPSSEVFSMFDQLLILAEGRVAYMGPSNNAIAFFASQGYSCPNNYNPADYYIYTMAIVPGKEVDCRARVEKVCDVFDESEHAKQIDENIQAISADNEDDADAWVDLSAIKSYRANWCLQFGAVLHRSWLANFRDPNLLKIRLLQTFVIGVILGLVYLQQDMNQSAIQNINGALFLIITNMSFSNMFAVVNSFPTELPIFMREHGSRLYRVDVYFLSKTIAELPNFILFPAVFSAVIYWMIGLYAAAEQFFIFMAIMIFVSNIAVSFGYVISCLSGSVNIALAVAPPLLIPLMLFGGFYVNSGTVPEYFVWLEYMSWFKYSMEIAVINQWENIDHIDCPPTPVNSTGPPPPCFPNGQAVIDSLDFSQDHVVLNLILLTSLFVGYRILAFILLLIRSRNL